MRGERRGPGRRPRASAGTQKRRSVAWWLIGAAASIVVVGAIVLAGSPPAGPRVGDHWHAPFKVVICGQRTPPLPASPGDIHTHGDDIIHIHPARAETAGRNATLGAFLAGTELRVTASSLEIRGRTYRNGDRCATGGPGRVTVLINGRPNPDFESHVPRDGDQIEFRFGP